YPNPLSFYLEALASSKAGLDFETVKKQSPGWPENRLRDRMQWLPTCAEQAIVQSYEGFHQEEFHSLWANATARTLFIRGANSPVVTTLDYAQLKKLRPDAQYASVDEAGHMIPWDNLFGFTHVVKEGVQLINSEHNL